MENHWDKKYLAYSTESHWNYIHTAQLAAAACNPDSNIASLSNVFVSELLPKDFNAPSYTLMYAMSMLLQRASSLLNFTDVSIYLVSDASSWLQIRSQSM